MTFIQSIQTILIALLGGGAVGFIQFLIQRHDERHDKSIEILSAIKKLDDKINTLDMKIDTVDAKGDERNAISSRVRILRFSDEMMDDRRHSKDSWDQCLTDITEYTKYCDAHPDFKNDQTAATVDFLRTSYQDRLKKHDFL